MGGFNYENNKNNPRIYKHSDELSLCSKFVKEFKIALYPILQFVNDGTLHQRLMALFMKIKSLDSGGATEHRLVGKGLKTLKGKQLLREFVFTPKVGIRQQFGNPLIHDADFSLEWKALAPSKAKFPKGATHFDLQYILVVYNVQENSFVTYDSAPLRFSKRDVIQHVHIHLESAIRREEYCFYLPLISIRFMEVLGKEEYPSLGKDGVGVEVLGVFG
ncbi:hypothetical protein [Aequorivita echinoideorum]|uniref:Uncharacterized protein n=1 Tax=Aequorivita echinoideorum TaxID=1549647 RepID=A0ABS5S5B4_9FLAO|nr:hypothetical protein [Aequorivita echinoideorum]MBT0608379.1 hypothetical protein [Aequorivita echinoideorum]